MKNNKLIEYKNNIWNKISRFFKRIFSKRKQQEQCIDSNLPKNSYLNREDDFLNRIQIKKSEDEIKIRKLQVLYDNGEIDEDELSEDEIEKLIDLYESETEKLNADTERRKVHIQNMLNELKKL